VALILIERENLLVICFVLVFGFIFLFRWTRILNNPALSRIVIEIVGGRTRG